MIDPKELRKDPGRFRRVLRERGLAGIDVDTVVRRHEEIMERQMRLEKLRAEKNRASKRIPTLTGPDRAALLAELKAQDTEADDLEGLVRQLIAEQEHDLRQFPNPHADDVPIGRDDSANRVVETWGTPPTFSFPVKDSLTLGIALDLIDVARPAKMSGSRFGALRREAAQLEFALVQFALRVLTKPAYGFIPIVPPVLINRESMQGMGYLDRPSDADEVYRLAQDNLVLVGTSEQSIGPMHQGDTLDGANLPLRYVSFSTCFRREAGSYGKDTHGILRVHQFDKIEMFSFTRPEQSDKEHQFLVDRQKELLQALGIPHRVVLLSSGDMGFQSARTVDIECWIPSENRYRETNSCSTCRDFQARRLNIRYRHGGERGYVHTLNGTAFAIGRTLIAILENFQQADGSIVVPEALRPYVPFTTIARA
ncbi:MAG: serine--tRNA ligase [Candidatus Kerfeldbacteria bacterium]|nr:serine--tRNA ligase [Candidatus Kerfeldbacteria bacterium]